MRQSRPFRAFLVAVLAAGCSGGADEQGPPPEPLLPGGYKAVVDVGRSDPGHLEISDTAEALRFTTGPAATAWRPQDTVSTGDVRVEASLKVYGAPVSYSEGYGVFVGGTSMDRPALQRYTYILVRPSGDFTIRRRAGDTVETVVEWTPHPAVQPVGIDGAEPVNTLVIQVVAGTTDFLINGTRVFSMDPGEVAVRGVAGIRMNHRLDLGLTAWSVGPPPSPAPDSTATGS